MEQDGQPAYEAIHSRSREEVFEEFNTGYQGLTSAEANRRRATHGVNEIPRGDGVSPLAIFVNQLKSPLIYILIAAALISFAVGHMIDFWVILVLVAINAVIGFSQEYRAERAIAALEKMIVPRASVIRGGEVHDIPARELVPGDLLLFEEGDRVPADARLIDARTMSTVEAALTGESGSVRKDVEPVPAETAMADRSNMVWSGTYIADGDGKAVVVHTGADTQLGRIARSIGEASDVALRAHRLSDEARWTVAAVHCSGCIGTYGELDSTGRRRVDLAVVSDARPAVDRRDRPACLV